MGANWPRMSAPCGKWLSSDFSQADEFIDSRARHGRVSRGRHGRRHPEVTVGGETGEDADVFTIRNGKTVRAEMHGDTALLERVFGKKQLATG